MRRRLFAFVGCLLLLPIVDGSAQDVVAIQRRKVTITPVDAYRLPLRLEPVRSVTITAPCDGVIKMVTEKEGKSVNPQFELMRIDNPRLDLVTKRASAARELAQQELRIARGSNNAEQIKLGEAKVALAEAEWSLAAFDQGATSIRAPYGATILRIHVAEGQQVKAGEPLIVIGDVSQLKVRLPVDRDIAKAGEVTEITVESQTVSGAIDSVAPLDADHDKQRELAVSAATAVIKFDNASGKFHPGQIVYGPLAPKGPVMSVPLTTVKTDSGGQRMVQVVREGVVRSIPIALHGQIGKESVFVSGQFTEHDELVLSTSRDIADGTALKPAAPGQAVTGSPKPTTPTPAATSPGAAPPKKNTNAAGL